MSKLVKAAGATKSLIFNHLKRAIHKTRPLLSPLLKIKHYFFGNDENEDDKRLRRSSVYSSLRWRYYWSTSNHVRPLPEPILVLQGSANYYIEGEEVDIVSCSSSPCNKTMVVLPDDQVEVEEGSYSEAGTPPWCTSQRYDGMDMDDINRLAEMFIANCHEKFVLEKEESYRMYQDMLARGL